MVDNDVDCHSWIFIWIYMDDIFQWLTYRKRQQNDFGLFSFHSERKYTGVDLVAGYKSTISDKMPFVCLFEL